jgi:hypothetical protein
VFDLPFVLLQSCAFPAGVVSTDKIGCTSLVEGLERHEGEIL